MLERNPSWDWRDLTFRAIAAETGLSERTLYRYFASEEDLHGAILDSLVRKSGTTVEASSLDGVLANIVGFLSWYVRHAVPADPGGSPDPGATALVRRRSIAEAVGSATTGWDPADTTVAVAVLDLLSNARIYEPLLRSWRMSAEQTTAAAAWLTGLVVDAIKRDVPPATAWPAHPGQMGRPHGEPDEHR